MCETVNIPSLMPCLFTKMSNKKNSFKLETKYKIIKLIEKKVLFNEIVDQFKEEGVKIKNIYKFNKNRSKIIEDFEKGIPSQRRLCKRSGFPDVDKELLDFVAKAPSDGLLVNEEVLRVKAIEIADKHGYNEFKGSNGFIDRFKRRHNIKFTAFHGEASGVSEEVCNDWITVKLPEIRKDYEAKDIYNGDELGLFWRLLPNKSYVIQGSQFKSGKQSKDRISIFIATNAEGDKLKPIVIGKFKTPRCFRGKSRVPVIYRYNSRAWMTSDIWTEYMTKLNKTMVSENRKIILFVDNCSAHPFIELSNIKIVFLPPNTTSRLQPMDAGVIHSLKSSYRQRLIKRLLVIYDEKKVVDVKGIELYEAITMLKNAWDEMDPQIIVNCFSKSGFTLNNDSEFNCNVSYDLNDWTQITEALDSIDLEYNEYVSCDDQTVCQDLNSGDIPLPEEVHIGSDEERTDSEEEFETEDTITLNDGFKAINMLRKLLTQYDCPENNFDLLNKLESVLYSRRFVPSFQSKITKYFK